MDSISKIYAEALDRLHWRVSGQPGVSIDMVNYWEKEVLLSYYSLPSNERVGACSLRDKSDTEGG